MILKKLKVLVNFFNYLDHALWCMCTFEPIWAVVLVFPFLFPHFYMFNSVSVKFFCFGKTGVYDLLNIPVGSMVEPSCRGASCHARSSHWTN